MKQILLIPFVLTLPLVADPAATEFVPPAPPSNPCLFTWFAGGSVGYLTELEEPMYNIHVGNITCWNLAGWNIAMFAEGGYVEKEESYSPGRGFKPLPSGNRNSFNLDELGEALQSAATDRRVNTGYELDILPVTFNVKLERPIASNLKAYFGAGLGSANADLSINARRNNRSEGISDDDWVFTAQAFAGLNCNITRNFEIYGGARWIYFDDAKISLRGNSSTLELEDDFLFELGARYHF